MKARKKILIFASISILSLLFAVGVVFAAYSFIKNISVDSTVGTIEIKNKKYYDYSAGINLNESDANYKNATKLRTDTVAVVDGIILSSTSTYTVTNDSIFIDGVRYFYKEGNDYIYDPSVVVGAKVSEAGKTYYNETKTYNGISAISNAYYPVYDEGEFDSFEIIENPTINNSNITFLVDTLSIQISCVIDSSLGIITSASVTTASGSYRAVIDVDGLGMVILDNDATYRRVLDAEERAITCSASENKYDDTGIYLSQLGLHFEFETEIPVYVRIHIQDAWKRTRKYTSSVKELYILKDQINGVSPFNVSDEEWFYDVATNCVYLKQQYIPIQNPDGTYPTQSYTFNVNEAYFYSTVSSIAFTEYIDVEVSFTVDIIQANRAKTVWGLDPSELA